MMVHENRIKIKHKTQKNRNKDNKNIVGFKE